MELKFIVESILFAAQRPLSPKEIRDTLVTAAGEAAEGSEVRAFKRTPVDNVVTALEELARDHEQAGRSYRLAGVAGAWQFVSQPEYFPWIKALVGHKSRPPRLSQPGLETLAIIAYRQPVTRAEIEQVRGVAVDGVMQTLLERGLVAPIGRADVVGRPITFGTTPAFLEYFGLNSLDEMPAADELRRIPVSKPEALLTVDSGLATAPPEQLTMAEGNAGQPAESAAAAPSDSSHERAPQPEPGPGSSATAEPAVAAGHPSVVEAETPPEAHASEPGKAGAEPNLSPDAGANQEAEAEPGVNRVAPRKGRTKAKAD